MKRFLPYLLWIAVGAATVGLHPALRVGTPLESLSRQIAADAETQRVHLEPYWNFAGWALVASLLYITLFALFRLTPAAGERPHELPWPLGLGVVLGFLATFLARDAKALYFLAAGIPALSLPFLRRPATPGRGSIVVCVLGLILVLLGMAVDAGLASLTGAPLLPDAWFPIATERPVMAAAVTIVLLASCAALALPRAGALAIAPACVLVLGPSSPFKGLAVGLVIGLMSRAGAGPGWRFGFIVAILALHVVAAVRL